jgi:hypothetical protein
MWEVNVEGTTKLRARGVTGCLNKKHDGAQAIVEAGSRQFCLCVALLCGLFLIITNQQEPDLLSEHLLLLL